MSFLHINFLVCANSFIICLFDGLNVIVQRCYFGLVQKQRKILHNVWSFWRLGSISVWIDLWFAYEIDESVGISIESRLMLENLVVT